MVHSRHRPSVSSVPRITGHSRADIAGFTGAIPSFGDDAGEADV
jgi:hypothetical protein